LWTDFECYEYKKRVDWSPLLATERLNASKRDCFSALEWENKRLFYFT